MNQLPSDGLDTFATLADVEMKKLDEQVRHGFNRVIREASKAGMINSSNAMVMVAAEAANSVPVRAHTLQNLMVRCLSDYGVPMSKATAEWATERLRTYLVHQCGSLRDLVRATAPFQGSLSYGPPLRMPLCRISTTRRCSNSEGSRLRSTLWSRQHHAKARPTITRDRKQTCSMVPSTWSRDRAAIALRSSISMLMPKTNWCRPSTQSQAPLANKMRRPYPLTLMKCVSLRSKVRQNSRSLGPIRVRCARSLQGWALRS